MVCFVWEQQGKLFQRILQSRELSFRANTTENFLQDRSRYTEGSVLLYQLYEPFGQGRDGMVATKHDRQHRAIEDNHRFLRAAL